MSLRPRVLSLGTSVLISLTATLLAQQTRTTWKDYLGGPDSSHYSALSQINRKNVDKLEIAWKYDTGDDLSYTFSPLVVDNMAYFAAKNGSLVAVDATNGKELWVHPFVTPSGAPATFARFAGITGQRGGNYWESKDRSDRRLFISASGFLHAVDAKTGQSIESFGDHGKVDLKIGIDRAPRGLSARSAGRVFENILILGSATGEGYLAPPGDLRAFDVVSGKLLWVFHTIPHPGELGYETWPKDAYTYMGGVDVWGEITVDEKRGIAYFPVASPKYELYGGDRPGDNLFADCLLALDARTGKYLWHYQTIHHDIWDYDPTAAPQLVTVKHDGKDVDVVALASKNGFLYVFDRVTGKPIWPILEKPVPKSDVPGEVTSPTQPFPTAPPPFARQTMTEYDMYDAFMTPEEKVHWKERLKNARKGFYTPLGLVDTISLPSVNGGALFFSSGVDPTTGTVYVESKDMPSIMKLVPAGESTSANAGSTIPARPKRDSARRISPFAAFTPERQGRAVFEQNCQVCHGPELKGDRGPAIDTAVQRLGVDGTRAVITNGRAGMPPFPKLPEEAMTTLLAFLSDPGSAPPGSAAPATSLRAMFPSEPDYPSNVTPPPSRYKTGYGNESYVIKPPWTTLTAYDLNTGKIKWKEPYGDLPQAGPSKELRGNVYPKSGFAITAGGLIIYAGNDSKLYAIDKDTGRLITTKDLPNGSLGQPAVYQVNGREYILLAVSGGNPYPEGATMAPGGVMPPATGKYYIAFALPETGRNTTN